MKFTNPTGSPISTLIESKFIDKTNNEYNTYIPLKNQICIIKNVKASELKGAYINYNGNLFGLKIGDGTTSVNNLAWVGVKEIEVLSKSATKDFLYTQEGKNIINGIISAYLTNNDTGDDLGDGIIINCN